VRNISQQEFVVIKSQKRSNLVMLLRNRHKIVWTLHFQG
jgi:hypothetical protein